MRRWQKIWNDIEKSKFGAEVIGNCNRIGHSANRCPSEVCSEQERVAPGRADPGRRTRIRPDGQNWALGLAKNVFCGRPEEQLAYIVSSARAHDNKIDTLSSDDRLQLR